MKRMLLVLLLAALFLTGCGVSAKDRQQQLSLRSEGMEAAAQGEYEAAIESYDAALALANRTVSSIELDVAAYKAAALYHTGDTEGAIELYTAILDLKESSEIYLSRGLLYREEGDTDSANADFQKAMDLTSKKDLVTLGRLSYYMGEYALAKSYLEEATVNGDIEAVYWQAELYWEMGNKDYALTLYQSYLSSGGSTRADAYEKVAAYQIEQGDYVSALATLEAGIALGESDVLQSLLAARIAVYEYQSNWEKAKSLMESYLKSYPDDEDALREYEFLQTR